MSTDTSSLFQMVHERGWQWGVSSHLRGELSRWFTSRKAWLHILTWLLVISLILFFTTTGLSEAIKAADAILNLQALAFQARGEPIPARAALERALALADSEQTVPSQTQTPKQALVEPLSQRELEILELIAEGLTNSQIASRLYLSTNTVKAHTRNIYGKLDSHSRTQAVAHARALGLLPSCIQEARHTNPQLLAK